MQAAENWPMLLRSGAIVMLCCALVAGVRELASSEPRATTPGAVAFRLGDIELVALRDAQNVVANDGHVFGVGIGTDKVAGVLERAGKRTDKLTLAVDALLVKMHGRILLFDTGLGPGIPGALIASLAQAQVAPADVTDIFITHSHGDHVGGLLAANGRPAFARAVIHMSAREWAHMQSEPESESIAHAVRSHVATFMPGSSVVPGVRAIALYGHTPGHVGYEIGLAGAKLLDAGDVGHSSIISLAKPDWPIGYDSDRSAGAAIRRATLMRLAASHEWVFFPHFPFPGVGKIERAGDAFAWRAGLP